MTQQELSQAKDPDLRTSLQAMLRAAELARKTAMQTGTDIVIVENQQIVRLSAHKLQQQDKPA
ncbi:hypothetical protein [Leptothrix ochracea]|jgi:hypothetical protein|uniref:hypothetical protein n=1 Tax=Leptothrix ochracea TaxID=735331 RepID=UPI0034E23F03